MRWVGHVARVGEKRNAYRLIVGKPLGKLRHRWVDNIKMDPLEMSLVGVDWIGLLVSAVMNLWVP
jgi:hypothetical protein